MAQPQRKTTEPGDDTIPERPKLTSVPGGGKLSGDRKTGHLSLIKNDNYDDDSSGKPITGPDLSVIDGGGESTPERGDLHAVNDEGEEEDDTGSNDRKKAREDEEEGSKPGQTEGDQAEQSALDGDEEQNGPGFYRDDGKPKKGKDKQSLKASRNKKLIGVGATGGILALIIGLFLTLIPLKIVALMDTLQDRFGASSQSAVSRRSEKLFDSWVKKHILPSLRGTGVCSTTRTIDRTCYSVVPGASPASRLFSAWSDARLENKMATKYGLEIASNGAQGTFTIKARGVPDTVVNTRNFITGTDSLADAIEKSPGGTKEFRQKYRAAFSEAFEGESRLKRVFYRFKFGRLMERKHQVRRCAFACFDNALNRTQDDFSDWKTNKKLAAKLLLIRRVVEPHNEIVGLALGCILSGGCSDLPKPTADGKERQDALEAKIRAYLEKRGTMYTKETGEALVKLVPVLTDIADKGVTTYLITTVIEKLLTQQIADMAAKGIPVVGWVDVTARVINFLHDSGPKIKRWGYVMNSTAYVSTYMIYRTLADEMKSGHVDPEIVGSMMDSLGDETGDKDHRGQAAEVSPLYENIFGSSGSQTASLFDIFSPSALAQGATVKAPIAYTCDNGELPALGKLICPEESLITNNWLTEFSAAFSKPPLNVLSEVAAFWKSTGGAVLSAVNSILAPVFGAFNFILDNFPILKTVKGFFETQIGALFQVIAMWMFPSPLSPTQSGARTLNANVGGADAANSTMGQDGIGGQLLTPQQVADIRNDEDAESRQEFASKPFLYRMFSTETTRSFVSRLAMSFPSSKTELAQTTFANLITSPFNKLMQSFGSFFARPKLYAAAAEDPFGIPQFGYVLGDPIVNMDEEILTDDYCKNLNALWVENDVVINPTNGVIISTTPLPPEGDPDVGIDVHHSTNPCLLEQTTVGSAGGYFDASTLSPGDVSTQGAP